MVAWGNIITSEPTPYIQDSISECICPSCVDNIKLLAESGKICEIYGHNWNDDVWEWKNCSIETFTSNIQYATSCPEKSIKRHCIICNLKQYRDDEWRDENDH